MNFYPASPQPVPTPAVRSGFLGDLYVNLMAFRSDGSNATIKVIYEPLVPWIWFGGGVVVLGALVSMSPTWRRRTADAPVPVAAAPIVVPPALAPGMDA
jgi:cytochrome c-type biogenesis protein CcmF